MSEESQVPTVQQAPPKIQITIDVDMEQRQVALVLEPVKVRVFLDDRQAADLASALVRASMALRQRAPLERQQVTVPRDGPLMPKPDFFTRPFPRHKK